MKGFLTAVSKQTRLFSIFLTQKNKNIKKPCFLADIAFEKLQESATNGLQINNKIV